MGKASLTFFFYRSILSNTPQRHSIASLGN